MIKKNTILIIIFLVNCCFGQGINDNWNFGGYASVSFPLGGAPVAIVNSAFATDEGSSSISDTKCNLLSYSDGGCKLYAIIRLVKN